ncbi:MAG: hypothetical protein GY811_30460 [Myxococcales bacterium]|nr:hypothetical protein [Myxococcales bacterium]
MLCERDEATQELVLSDSDWVFDTDNGKLVGPNGELIVESETIYQGISPEVRLMMLGSFTISEGGKLKVVGTRPLVIAAWGGILIEGHLWADSTDERPGPGAESSMGCENTGTISGSDNMDGEGAGGTRGGKGGGGGDGNDGVGANGGRAAPISSLPEIFRGGCPGGKGGNLGCDGGHGGGAVLLAAQDGISISGKITMGGHGGRAASAASAGGGGGGSGGMLILAADGLLVDESAVILAKGGGGGGGTTGNGIAFPGKSGNLSLDTSPAPGGEGANGAGKGGAGSGGSQDSSGRKGGNGDSGSGGGGGGSAGIIRIDLPAASSPSISPTALFSPAYRP